MVGHAVCVTPLDEFRDEHRVAHTCDDCATIRVRGYEHSPIASDAIQASPVEESPYRLGRDHLGTDPSRQMALASIVFALTKEGV